MKSAVPVQRADFDAELTGPVKDVFGARSIAVSAAASPICKVDAGLHAAHDVERLRWVICVADRLGGNA